MVKTLVEIVDDAELLQRLAGAVDELNLEARPLTDAAHQWAGDRHQHGILPPGGSHTNHPDRHRGNQRMNAKPTPRHQHTSHSPVLTPEILSAKGYHGRLPRVNGGCGGFQAPADTGRPLLRRCRILRATETPWQRSAQVGKPAATGLWQCLPQVGKPAATGPWCLPQVGKPAATGPVAARSAGRKPAATGPFSPRNDGERCPPRPCTPHPRRCSWPCRQSARCAWQPS